MAPVTSANKRSPQLPGGPNGQLLAVDFDIVPHIHRKRFADQNLLDFLCVVRALTELAQLAYKLMPTSSSARHSAEAGLNYNCGAPILRCSDSDER